MKILILIALLSLPGAASQAQYYQVPRDTSYNLHQSLVKERKQRPYIVPVQQSKPRGIKELRDVVYKTIIDTTKGKRELHADIYRPNNNKTLPALIMVHGGGWNSGDKSMQRPLAEQMAQRGYVAIPVEYRLIPEALFPAAVDDLKSVVRWVGDNANKYGIDPHKIAISGCSAGGHLANLIGMSNDSGVALQAVVNIDGISTFCAPTIIERAQNASDNNLKPPVDMIWLGGTYAQKRDNWQQASPMFHISPRSAQVCFINSSIARFHEGRQEQIAKLDSLGIRSKVVTFDDTPHTFWLFRPWFSRTVDVMTRYLDSVMK